MNINQFTRDGKFLMLAFDHRDSFRKMINSSNPNDIDINYAIDLKREIISSVYNQFSSLLIDCDFGYKAYLKMNLESPKPFLLPIEKSGYKDEVGERITEIEYSAKQLKDMGASGIKLLIYFNPNCKSSKKQLETAKKVLEEVHEENLPLFLEIVTYNLDDKDNDSDIVVNSLRMFLENNIKPDVYKLEYPGSLENSKKITQMLEDTPWILLTRGSSFEIFTKQLEEAVKGGCMGFLAGRSLWQEIPQTTSEAKRKELLAKTLPNRFRIISNIVLE